ncbi:MAG: hypothetical protein QOE83_1224 [Actinomycetota bacterium]|jgi:outer membrane protein assembly factor BamB|nr:hypothetical protein [Actinomycetota bacterium]
MPSPVARIPVLRCLASIIATACFVTMVGVTPASAYTKTPRSTWAADDVVLSIVHIGSVTYIAGRFTHLVSPSGSQIIARQHLAELDADGNPLPWDPGASDTVNVLVASGNTLYAAGRFATIAGHSQANIGAFDLTTGSFLTSFHPHVFGGIFTATPAPEYGSLYLGGGFTTIDGVAQANLGAISLTTGALVSSFRPGPLKPGQNGTNVRGVVVTAGRVVADGDFIPHISSFDPVTGDTQSWADHTPWRFLSLATDGTNVYGGSGNGGGHVIAYRLSDGTALWQHRGDGNVQHIAIGPTGLVFVAGHFDHIDSKPRNFLAVFAPSDGTLRPYRIVTVPCCYGGIWGIDVEPDMLYVGGRFDSIGGVIQRRYAEIPA